MAVCIRKMHSATAKYDCQCHEHVQKSEMFVALVLRRQVTLAGANPAGERNSFNCRSCSRTVWFGKVTHTAW